MPDEYVRLALIRLGEQLNATKKMWDVNEKKLIDIPDEKIRQDAALAILAYKWGRPVERQVNVNAPAADFPNLLERLRNCPSYQAMMQNNEPKPVLGKEIPPAIEDAKSERIGNPG